MQGAVKNLTDGSNDSGQRSMQETRHDLLNYRRSFVKHAKLENKKIIVIELGAAA